MLVCPHVRGIHRQQLLDILGHLSVHPEHRGNVGEHLVAGTIQRPTVMALPHRLPRPELSGQVPPRTSRTEPPRDPFQDKPVIAKPSAGLAPSCDGINGSTTAQNSSEITPTRVTGQSSLASNLKIWETRPRRGLQR